MSAGSQGSSGIAGIGRAALNALSGDSTPTDAAAYLQMAGESDLYEINSSQLALQKSQNPDIRRLASMLIDHHTQTTNATLAAARAGGVAPSPAVLGPDKRRMLDQLTAEQGRSFDSRYVAQQIPAHEQALALHSTYARSGDNASLRASAEQAVPIVQSHLDQLRRLQSPTS
jgi:putative membrane protein